MSRTACLNAIYELAKTDERVVFIGSDLAPNTLAKFKEEFPDRFYMEGVQEQHIIGMAAGLAKEGYIPFVNTIASFLTRRCYEQVAIDVCAHNLPVRLIGNGGGLLYTPLGLTHCAIEDIAIMRALPNMSVICCSDSEEMTQFMPTTLTNPSPMYIRLGKDADAILEKSSEYVESQFVYFSDFGAPVCIISTGVMTHRAVQAAKMLPFHSHVVHVPSIKPMNPIFLNECRRAKLVVTIEEGISSGGLGTVVLETLNDNGIYKPVLRLGLPDAFPHHYGEQDDLLRTYGLQPEQIAERVKAAYERL